MTVSVHAADTGTFIGRQSELYIPDPQDRHISDEQMIACGDAGHA